MPIELTYVYVVVLPQGKELPNSLPLHFSLIFRADVGF